MEEARQPGLERKTRMELRRSQDNLKPNDKQLKSRGNLRPNGSQKYHNLFEEGFAERHPEAEHKEE